MGNIFIIKGKLSNVNINVFGIFILVLDQASKRIIAHSAVGHSGFINFVDIGTKNTTQILEDMEQFLLNGEASISISQKLQKSFTEESNGFLRYKNIGGSHHRIEVAIKSQLKLLFGKNSQVTIFLEEASSDAEELYSKNLISHVTNTVNGEIEASLRRTYNIEHNVDIILLNAKTDIKGTMSSHLKAGSMLVCKAQNKGFNSINMLSQHNLIGEDSQYPYIPFPINKIINRGDFVSILVEINHNTIGVIEDVNSETKLFVEVIEEETLEDPLQDEIPVSIEQQVSTPTSLQGYIDKHPVLYLVIQLLPFIIALLFILIILL